MVQEFVEHYTNVLGDLTQQNRRNISSRVDRHRCAPAVLVTELLVRAMLTDLDEAERFENGNNLAGTGILPMLRELSRFAYQ